MRVGGAELLTRQPVPACAAIPSNAAIACLGRSSVAAARFSRKWTREEVPGIRSTLGARRSSQASATCIVVTPRPCATSERTDDCSGVKPPRGKRFLAAYPEIRLEVVAEDSFVDVLAAGFDAGIRYDERLQQDMIAIPIGPRIQRFAVAAAPAYLDRHGRPRHPRELLGHACLRGRFTSRAMPPWEFERDGEVVRIDPTGPLVVSLGTATDLAVEAAIAGTGIISSFEDWLRPHFESGALEPVLEPWWQSFSGPFLYYSGRRLVPAPLRAFIDFVRASALPAAPRAAKRRRTGASSHR